MKSPLIKIPKDTKEMIKEFGYTESEFIARAIEEKLVELRKLQFFALSEKVRKGLQKKGIRGEAFLREINS